MSPAEKRAREEQADRKSGEAAGRRYNALSSVEPSKDPRDDVRGQKGYKKGGMVKKRRYAEGGETDKEEGLKASKDEKVGFFERMRMGNIDEEGSEAYNRFGAGRGRAERVKLVPVEDRVATPVIRESAKQEPAKADDSGDFYEAGSGVVNDIKPDMPKKRVNVETAKPSTASKPKSSPKADTSNYSNKGRSSPTVKTDTSNYSNEGRGRAMSKEQQFKFADEQARSPEGVARRKKMEKDQAVERFYPEEMLIGGPGLKGIQQLAKKAAGTTAPKAAQEGAKKRAALKRDVEEGIDRNLADEVKNYSASAAEKAVAAKQAAAKTKAERSRDLAAGQAKTKFTSTSKTPSKKTKKFDDDETNVEFKRGGSTAKSSKPAAKGWGMARGARPAKMR